MKNQVCHEDTFSKTLFGLAEFTGKKISAQLHDIYMDALKPYGLERVNTILIEFLKYGKFPTVVEIENRLGITTVDTTDEEKARLLSSKILKVIERYGCSSPSHEEESMSQFTDDERKLVIAFMPWRDWCNENMVNYDNWPTISAQFREYCKALGNQKRYDTHLEIKGSSSNIISSLLDNKIQKLIDEIPF